MIRPFFSILVALILLASSFIVIFPSRIALADSYHESGLLTNVGIFLSGQPDSIQRQTLGGSATTDLLNINGAPVSKISIKSDYGLIRFGPDLLKFNSTPKRTLVYGSGDASLLSQNARVLSYAGSGRPGSPMLGYAISNNPVPASSGFSFSSDAPLQFDNGTSYDKALASSLFDSGRFSGSSIIGADQAADKYKVTGSGVKVAIVDTGTDFSNPDVKNSVARDSNGVPIMIDADGQGIVLTRAKYIAKFDASGDLINYYGNRTTTSENKIPGNFTSYVYVNSTSGVYLRTSQGNIPVYNSLYPYAGTPILNATANVDWRIGNSTTDFIKSMSGVYRFGVIFQAHTQLGSLTLLLIPVLVVDSEKAGVYDTIIPDMRAGWGFFARDVLASNPGTAKLVPKDIVPDFTGQPKIKIGSGNENLVYDYNNDGYPDFSAGTVGARVADIWQVTGKVAQTALDKGYGGIVHANLLQPFDPNGDYFGVMYDSQGHGTSTAALVSSKGAQRYNIYQNGTEFQLRGMAPDAKIIPVKALWAGDALYGWLYASGFDPEVATGNWKYTGAHKADIVSNSWGVSSFPLLGYGQGYDLLSVYSSLLMAPGLLAKNYPGTLFVISAGNDGIGYGTLGSPNASPLAISVGATTNNVHVGSPGFGNITRFGGSTHSYDDIADFSSRGPGVFGDPKPELMAVGSYGFTPWIVTYQTVQSKSANSTKNDAAFTLFGGTSMACPMVAGAAALVMQDMKDRGQTPDPFVVKSILMSTAKDLNNDPFTQGSGRVDVLSALEMEHGAAGMFSVSTNNTVSNILSQMSRSFHDYNDTFSLIDGGASLQKRLYTFAQPEGRWFAGQIQQGGSAHAQLTITNPSKSNAISVTVNSASEKLIGHKVIQNTTKLFQKDELHSSKEFGYVPNYYNLTKEIGSIPKNADLMVARLNIPFNYFMNSSEVFGDYLRIASIYAYDWNDTNHDGKVSYNETEMINRGGSWGTVQDLMITAPSTKFQHTPLIGVYPVPTIFSFWRGDRHINSTAMNFTLSIDFYQRQQDSSMRFDNSIFGQSANVTVLPGETAQVQATLVTSEDALPGNYEGWIKAVDIKSNHNVMFPVSYIVTTRPVPKDVPVVIRPASASMSLANEVENFARVHPTGGIMNSTSGAIMIQNPSNSFAGTFYEGSVGLRPNGYIGGPFDMLSRYTAGDWRSYYFNISDATINNFALKISWPSNYTSINAMAFAPDGKLIGSSVPSGVFSTFAGWASNDWLGTTSVSQGGGFYFSQNDGGNATVLNVPVNGTGIYSLLLHNTLFSGTTLYEPVTVLAKFSTIRPDTAAPTISVNLPNLISSSASRASITLKDDDPAGYYYSIDNGSFTFRNTTTDNITIDGAHLTEGKHQLLIEAVDTVGHSSTVIQTFAVDKTPPTVSLMLGYRSGTIRDISGFASHLKNPLIVPGGTKLYWNVSDASGISVPYNVTIPFSAARTFSNLSGSTLLSLSEPGSKGNSIGSANTTGTFSLSASDKVGNAVQKSILVTVDDKPPVVALAVSGGELRGNTTIGIKASDDIDISNLMLDIGGRKMVNVTGMAEYQLDTAQLPDGNYKVQLTGTDSVGNSAVASANIHVVNFQPIVEQTELFGILAGLGIATAGWVAVIVARRKRELDKKGEPLQ